jgi:DNA-binding Xre family transcriptional regulator
MPTSNDLEAHGLHNGTRCSNNLIAFQRLAKLVDRQKFFFRLGQRIRALRRKQGNSQEDMMSFNFSARHWQQIEAGRPITVSTLLRICAVFEISICRLVRGLDKGNYKQ